MNLVSLPFGQRYRQPWTQFWKDEFRSLMHLWEAMMSREPLRSSSSHCLGQDTALVPRGKLEKISTPCCTIYSLGEIQAWGTSSIVIIIPCWCCYYRYLLLRQDWNSWSSCLSLLTNGTAGLCHHAQWRQHFKTKFLGDLSIEQNRVHQPRVIFDLVPGVPPFPLLYKHQQWPQIKFPSTTRQLLFPHKDSE